MATCGCGGGIERQAPHNRGRHHDGQRCTCVCSPRITKEPPRLFAIGNQASNGAGGTLTCLRLSDGRSSFTMFSETSSPAEGAVGYESSGVLVDNHGHTETHL